MTTQQACSGRVLVPIDEQDRRECYARAKERVQRLMTKDADMPVRYEKPAYEVKTVSNERKQLFSSTRSRSLVHRRAYRNWSTAALLICTTVAIGTCVHL